MGNAERVKELLEVLGMGVSGNFCAAAEVAARPDGFFPRPPIPMISSRSSLSSSTLLLAAKPHPLSFGFSLQ
ncbi:hypothetical protein ACLOJK_032859 [Asimina triloba]